MKIKKQENRIRQILTDHPETRDNDHLLLKHIWIEDIGGNFWANEMTAMDLLNKISNKQLTNMVSVWRCRQKIQEHTPALRGESYKHRQKEQQPVKEEIKTWNDADQGEIFNIPNKTNLGDYNG